MFIAGIQREGETFGELEIREDQWKDEFERYNPIGNVPFKDNLAEVYNLPKQVVYAESVPGSTE